MHIFKQRFWGFQTEQKDIKFTSKNVSNVNIWVKHKRDNDPLISKQNPDETETRVGWFFEIINGNK